MPGSNPLFDIFGRSPVKPMQEHMAKINQCVAMLDPFFDAVFSQDWNKAASVRNEIAALEDEAGKLKRNIRVHLPNTLFLPMDRTDLLELLAMQDRVASRAKDIAGLILGRQMALPKAMEADYRTFLTRCIEATQQALTAINELDELVETGFRGRELKVVEKLVDELSRIEQDTDDLQVKVRAQLFAVEKSLNPIDAMFMYRIIDWTGDLADRSLSVGTRLELLAAR